MNPSAIPGPCANARGADVCPDTDAVMGQLVPLLPRGRAWNNHDGGPQASTVLFRFWRAVAAVFAFANRRICDLREEFWCATRTETDDLWRAEYGLPDGCDPFPDLCAKVAALGGSRCDYYRLIAARAGWAIDCVMRDTSCGARAGGARAGCTVPGRGVAPGVLVIRVDLSLSPAFTGRATTPARTGAFRAGLPLRCPPDLSALRCLMERIVPAHVELLMRDASLADTLTADAAETVDALGLAADGSFSF